jgi:hypothetical protein
LIFLNKLIDILNNGLGLLKCILLRGFYKVFGVIESAMWSLAKSRYVDAGMKSLDLWKSCLRGITVSSHRIQLILLSVDSDI